MRLIPVILLALTLNACCATYSYHRPQHHKRVRVTFYHRFEDRFGAKIAMGGRAKEGITIAAPPTYPFGLRLSIPIVAERLGCNDQFQVQDRGSMVTKRSSGQYDCVDVYLECRSKREGNRRIKSLSQQIGDYTDVFF